MNKEKLKFKALRKKIVDSIGSARDLEDLIIKISAADFVCNVAHSAINQEEQTPLERQADNADLN
jgi:hypothetical protein